VNGLTNGVTYSCSVVATNSIGNSSASASVNVTPATVPGAPTIGTATAGNGSASIAFTAPAYNGGSPVTTYAATCSATGQTTASANNATSPITVGSMTNGVTYACNVRAANAVGAGAASADASVKPVGPPGAPTIGTATPANASASIAFTAPASDGGFAITGYTVTCSATGQTTATASGTSSPITVASMTNGASYSCSVKATNALGSSAASGSATVVPRTVPGAPTIGTATAGDGSASVTFTAPSSNGGSAITGYTVSCNTGPSTPVTASGSASPLVVNGLTNGALYECSVKATNAAGTGAASGTATVTPAAPISTASQLCPYSHNKLNSKLGIYAVVSYTCNSTTRTMTSNQIPDHEPGTFPNSGNPHTISAQSGPASTTRLAPAISSTAGTAVDHVTGYALNGVKFDPATAESYQNQGVWKIEALNQTLFSAGVDNSNAHVQPNGAYHYHGMPDGYMTYLNKGQAMTLVGFAIDGFPVYAKWGYSSAMDATSAIREIKSSWRVKSTPDAGRPDVSLVAMGTFTQDFEYVEGLGDLDKCNGRLGVTPEFPNGIYHYYITTGFPYIQRCIKGTAP
jgi:hypothetical protein